MVHIKLDISALKIRYSHAATLKKFLWEKKIWHQNNFGRDIARSLVSKKQQRYLNEGKTKKGYASKTRNYLLFLMNIQIHAIQIM